MGRKRKQLPDRVTARLPDGEIVVLGCEMFGFDETTGGIYSYTIRRRKVRFISPVDIVEVKPVLRVAPARRRP